jgi:hypothetical protein
MHATRYPMSSKDVVACLLLSGLKSIESDLAAYYTRDCKDQITTHPVWSPALFVLKLQTPSHQSNRTKKYQNRKE